MKHEIDVPNIVALMKAGAEFHVEQLHWGDLKIQFKTYAQDSRPATPVEELQANQIAEDTLREEERGFRQDQLTEMVITDPLALEELIAQDLVEDTQDAQNSAE
jgi:hypothetical protein